MQKIILDTNVIVSALISKGAPWEIVYNIVLEHEVKMYVSEPVLKEYTEVLSRDKFARFKDFKANADLIVATITALAIVEYPNIELKVLQDKDDNKFLELAATVDADFIITGNTKHFNINEFRNTKIVTPAEYLENHRP